MGTETSSEAQVQGYNGSGDYNYPYANPLSQPYAKSSTANNYYNRMVLNDSFSRARENQSLDYYYSRAEYDRPKPNYTSYRKYPNPRYPNSYAEVPSTYRRPSYPRDYSAYYPPAVQTPMPPTTEVHSPAYAPIAAPQARPAPPPVAASTNPPTAQSYYPAAQSPLLSQQLYYRPSQPTLRPETAQQMAPPIEQQQIAAPQSQLSNYQYPAYSGNPVQQQSSLTQQGQIAPSYQYPAPTQVPTQVLTQAPTQATTRATTQQSSQQPVVHRIVIENIPSPYVYQPVQRSLSYCSDTEIHSVRYRPRYRKSYHHHRHRHHKRSSRKYVCLPPKEDYLNEVNCMPC